MPMSPGLAAFPEQEVSQAFGAAPRIIPKDPADPCFKKTGALHPFQVVASAPRALEWLAIFRLLASDRFIDLLCMLDGQCPLLDAQSDFQNLIDAELNIDFRLMAFSTGCAEQGKLSLTRGTNTILSLRNVLLNIDDGNFIFSYLADSRMLR
jgi:hypothetical protein